MQIVLYPRTIYFKTKIESISIFQIGKQFLQASPDSSYILQTQHKYCHKIFDNTKNICYKPEQKHLPFQTPVAPWTLTRSLKSLTCECDGGVEGEGQYHAPLVMAPLPHILPLLVLAVLSSLLTIITITIETMWTRDIIIDTVISWTLLNCRIKLVSWTSTSWRFQDLRKFWKCPRNCVSCDLYLKYVMIYQGISPISFCFMYHTWYCKMINKILDRVGAAVVWAIFCKLCEF